jgi:hypothetical protein
MKPQNLRGLTMIKYGSKILFSDKELACPCCGQINIADGADKKLLKLRVQFSLPMTINSACRCSIHNKEVGGSLRSFHKIQNDFYKTGGTCAFDIARQGGEYDCKLIQNALALGWSVGVAKSFIHIDRRIDYTNLPQTIYTY